MFLLGIIIIGALLDFKGFISNVSSEILGVFLGFLIAIFFLDHYQNALREKQWEKVRELTYGSLITNLSISIFNLFTFFEDTLPDIKVFRSLFMKFPQSDNAGSKALMDLHNIFREAPTDMWLEYSRKTFTYFEATRYHLDRISDILTPRILEFSDDKEIIDSLINFEEVQSRFQNIVSTDHEINHGASFFVLFDLIKGIHTIYSSLNKYYVAKE